jgi:hypothetical protein
MMTAPSNFTMSFPLPSTSAQGMNGEGFFRVLLMLFLFG